MHFDKILRSTRSRFDRRRFLIGAAGARCRRGLAAAALGRRAAPHTFKQGDFEITVLSDGHLVLPANLLRARRAAGGAEGVSGGDRRHRRERHAGRQPRAHPHRLRPDPVRQRVGRRASSRPPGKLIENLTAAGIDPASITKVVFTHGHPDHMWGTAADGATALPERHLLLGRGGVGFLERPGHPHARCRRTCTASSPARRSHYAAVKDRVTMLKPGDEIVTGIRALDTAGHTPGHLSFEVAGGEGLIIVADALVVPGGLLPASGVEVRLRRRSTTWRSRRARRCSTARRPTR